MPSYVVVYSWFHRKFITSNSSFAAKVAYILAGYSSLIIFFPPAVFAQGLSREECFKDTIAKLGCLPFYLGNIINGIFALSGIAAIILIIVSGIRLLASGGDAERVAKARKSLMYAIIGFLIVLGSFLILRVVSFVTGAECINALGFDTCS